MSRGLDIDRDDDRSRDDEARRARESREAHLLLRDDDERDPGRRSETVPSRDFALPDGRDRETVHLRAWGYRLRDTESQTLVAAGSFRVVFERDLRDGPYRGDAERLAQDVKALMWIDEWLMAAAREESERSIETGSSQPGDREMAGASGLRLVGRR